MRERGTDRRTTPGGRRACRLSLLAVAFFFLAARPAAALDGIDLAKDICAATFPRFEAAAERVAAFRGQPVERGRFWRPSFFHEIVPQVDRRLTWTVNDGSDATIDRFLVGVAWGALEARPAASCFVADKRGVTLAALQARFPIKDLVLTRENPEDVLSQALVTGVIEQADGQRIWLTLTPRPGQGALNPDTPIVIVTMIASDYLNSVGRWPR